MDWAIGNHDQASGRMRYVRDDSRPDMLWSTLDPARAMRWPSREAALGWARSLAPEAAERLESTTWRYVPLSPAEEPDFDVDLSVSIPASGAFAGAIAFNERKPLARNRP